MSWPLRDRCAISGIGATEFSRDSGRSVLALAVEASLAAIRDAGIPVDDIDGIVRCDLDEVQCHDLADALGLPTLSYFGTVGTAGTAPCGMVGQAAAAVMAGLAKTVVVFRSLNGRSGTRFGTRRGGRNLPVGGNGAYTEYSVPHGLVAPGQAYSILARRHMIDFGTTSEQLGHIAVACRNRANANPHAQMYDRKMTLQTYLDSPILTDPLRLFDYCLETDGACAVVVTSAARARDCLHPPVLIRSAAQASTTDFDGGMYAATLMRRDLTTHPSADTARILYERAGLGPDDIDVAQFYDCFTITVLMQLEDYGFCEKGEGGPFAASGALELDGQLPINTSGGNLSEGYIHGLSHILEGVRQIRGSSTQQLNSVENCLVTSGIPTATSALILARA